MNAQRVVVGALLRAHSRFSVQALTGRHPELRGAAFSTALARELARDQAWRQNMEQRVGRAVAAGKPTSQVLASERGHMLKHFSEAGRRIDWDVRIARMKADGETEGVWMLGAAKRHTPGCVARARVAFPIDRIPSPPHAGCQCSIERVRDVEARGVRVRRLGYDPGSLFREGGGELTEAIRVPFDPAKHPHAPAGRREGGQFVSVHGDLPQSVMPAVNAMLQAAARGAHRDVIDTHYRRAQKAIKRQLHYKRVPERTWYQHDQALGTLHRVYAAAINPEGDRVRVGTGVPLAPADREGITEGWDHEGNYRWRISTGALGRQHAAAIRKLEADKSVWSVRRHDNGDVDLAFAAGMPEGNRLQAATRLEIIFPQLRRHRALYDGDYLDDDRPLDLIDKATAADDQEGPWEATLYPGISSRRLGFAGELHINDAVEALRSMGVEIDDGSRLTTAEAGVRAGATKAGLPPLDWVLGHQYGVEVKSFAFRDIRPGWTGRGSLDPEERARKINMAKQLGVKPAIVRVGMDLPNNTAYLFFHEYPSWEEAYSDYRIPQEMMQDLLDGRLRSQEDRTARSRLDTKYRWVFLGAFDLRENPQVTGARRLTSQQMRDLSEKPGRHADVGVGGRTLAAPYRRESVREQQRREWREHKAGWVQAEEKIAELLAKGVSGAEIARRVKGGHGESVSPQYVSKVKARLEREGKLAREEQRKGPASVRDRIVALADEGVPRRQIARRVGTLPRMVDRVLDARDAGAPAPSSRPQLPPGRPPESARDRLRRRLGR